MRKLASAMVLALTLSSAPAAAQESVFAKVCAVEFDLDNLLPITPEVIAQSESCARIPLSHLSLVRALRLLRYDGAGVFEDHFVRAMIALPQGETIYIDRFGGFRRDRGSSFLSNRDLSRLQGYLDEMVDFGMKQRELLLRYDWAVKATRDLVARTEGWPLSDYGIGIGHVVGMGYRIGSYDSFKDQGPLVVKVWHKDDFVDYFKDDDLTRLGGGKSFELHFDPKTKALIRRLWGQ